MAATQDCNTAIAQCRIATQDAQAATAISLQQTSKCKSATDKATEAATNPPRINAQGYWEIYNATTGKYVATNNYALGGATYPVFGVDDEGFIYVESTEDDAERFSVDEDGFLVVNF